MSEELENDPVIYETLRRQLASQDLDLLCKQVIDCAYDDGEDRYLALGITYKRLRENLVNGALAIQELANLENLKDS